MVFQFASTVGIKFHSAWPEERCMKPATEKINAYLIFCMVKFFFQRLGTIYQFVLLARGKKKIHPKQLAC